MPPFEYRPYVSPNATTIADLLAHQHDAQAQATLTKGAAWAHAVRTIGQQLAQVPQQAQQLQQQQQATQLQGLQLDALQRQQHSAQVFEAVLKDPANYQPDGSIDNDKVTAALRAQDVPAWQQWVQISAANTKNALESQKTLAELQGKELDNAAKVRAAQQTRADYLGKLAYNGLAVLQQAPGDPLHARDTTLATVARAAADGMVTESEAKDFILRSAQVPPERLGALFGAFVSPELKQKLDKEAADTAKANAEAQKAGAEAGNLQQFGRTTKPNLEQKTVQLDGKPNALVNYDPASGQSFLPGSPAPIAPDRLRANPSASVQVNLNPQAQDARTNNAQQIVDGNMAPSMLSKRATDYNATLAEANKLNIQRTGKPLNLNKLQLDYEAAKRFVGTMNGQQMVRYRGLADSVVNTINEVQRLGDELQQGGVQKWNQVTRSTIRQVYGNTPQSELANQYVGAVNTLKDEFANLANGGFAPTDAAWKLANDQINADFGFKDLRASLTEVQRLINFRTGAMTGLSPVLAPDQSGGPLKVGGFTVVVKP